MPRAGFYNDNECRSYPFIFKATYAGVSRCPDTAIVDCGFIMGLDSGYDPAQHFVYLKSIQRTSQEFIFEFATNAPGAEDYPLVFTRSLTAVEWESEFVESGANTDVAFCATSPAWEGYLVTGLFAELASTLTGVGQLSFYAPENNSGGQTPDYEVEPARVQSLVKAYVRSINVGNYERVTVKPCTSSSSSGGTFSSSSAQANRRVIPYSAQSSCSSCSSSSLGAISGMCLTGDVKIKGGFNCVVQQTAYDNKILLVPRKGANIYTDPAQDRCQYGSEIPIYAGEQPPAGSEFLSGGPACGDLITSINGVGGKNVKIVGGTGVQITTDVANTVKIGLNATVIQQNC